MNHPLVESLIKEVEPLLQKDPSHDLSHCKRVAHWTVRLGTPLGVDPLLAWIAALAHDVVNVPKNSPDRSKASLLSAQWISSWLHTQRSQGHHSLTDAQVEQVADAVRTHSFSRGETPTNTLGKALQDADRLEALGALGIMRCVATGAKMDAQFFHPTDPWALHRELNDREFSIDHFFTKLLLLPPSFCTEEGKKEAEKRAQVLKDFLTQLRTELQLVVETSS